MKQNSLLLAVLLIGQVIAFAELRIGIIGCDTSHVTGFTEMLNNVEGKSHVPGGKVVAAYKGGSPDLQQSWSRVEEIAKELREKYGVKFYESIAELCANVDAILLESVDGRIHLAQARAVISARKPLFIDKPVAASLADAIEIFRLAQEANVPVWSSSSLRYGSGTQAVRLGKIGKVLAAETFSPCIPAEHHPELFWYGIHGIEALYTVMGTGCDSVQSRVMTNGAIEVVGNWSGGRRGVYRQDLAKKYGGYAKGERGEMLIGSHEGYAAILREIIKFFQTGNPPVPGGETIELVAFMTAAQHSKERGGELIRLSELNSALMDSNSLTEAERLAGWRLLWDGKTTTGWRRFRGTPTATNGWIIKDGTLGIPTTDGSESSGVGDLVTLERFSNFELRAEVRYAKGANSGIKYFVQPELVPVTSGGDPAAIGSAIGLEFQIIDDDNHPDGLGGRFGKHGLGALYDLIAPTVPKGTKPAGDWNSVRIVSEGRQVEHWLNGDKILHFERGTESFRQQVSASKFRAVMGFGDWSEGHILLQDHGNEVAFRNIKIRTLIPGN